MTGSRIYARLMARIVETLAGCAQAGGRWASLIFAVIGKKSHAVASTLSMILCGVATKF
jgi:hypothetical protein